MLRIPYPKSTEQFFTLAKLGGELRQLHLMKSPIIDETPVRFVDENRHAELVSASTQIPKQVRNDRHSERSEESIDDSVATLPQHDTASDIVTTRKYEVSADSTSGKVWINKTQYFDGVPQSAWNFYIGGYQVADKYLKDRKGRALTAAEIRHECRIIKVLTETARLMEKLDETWTV